MSQSDIETDIFSYINCSYLVFDHGGQFLTANSKTYHLLYNLDVKKEDFQNLDSLLSVLSDLEVDQDREAVQKIIKERALKHSNDVFCGIVGTSDCVVLVQVHKGLKGAFAVLSDVTSEYKYIDQAGDFPRDFIQSQKIEALAHMAGKVAQDLNNVLSVVRGYARMLAQDKDIKDDAQDKVENILTNVEKGAKLTQKIIDFSSDQSGEEKGVHCLTRLLERKKILLAPVLNQNITLNFEVEEEIYIECSRNYIFQILMNLFLRARDSMPKGGEITVSLQRCNNFTRENKEGGTEYCRLSVVDTGSSCSRQVMTRGNSDISYIASDSGDGRKIGMALVRSLIKDLGGYLDIVSSKGRGNAVSIYLPMLAPLEDNFSGSAEHRKLTSEEMQSLTLDQKTVLVVEDDEDLRTLLSDYLANKGMNVLVACDGAEAIDVENAYYGNIDFLISDIILPRLNGIDVARLFQATRPSTKVFMVSGYSENAIPSNIDLPSEISVITKPINFEKLEEKMLYALPQITHTEKSLSNIAGVI